MNTVSIPYITEYEHSLNKKYKELKACYIDTKKKANEIFDRNLENPLYCEKLKYKIDVSVLNFGKSNEFFYYETDCEKRIERSLNQSYLLDKTTLLEIFDVRKEIMNFNNSELSVSNLGTVLNDLREFFEDIEIDIERNKIIKKQPTRSITSDNLTLNYTEINHIDSFISNSDFKGKKNINQDNSDWKVIYG